MHFVTAFKIDAVLLLGFLVLCIWEEVRDRRKARNRRWYDEKPTMNRDGEDKV